MKKNSVLLNPNLEAFMAVAKHKSVHAGARAIFISQTAMTQRIQLLEKRLGTTLFVRASSGMILTTEGIALLRYCHTMQQLSDETIVEMKDAGIDHILRVKIAGPSSIMSSRIVSQCIPLMTKFPRLYLDFDVSDSEILIDTLIKGINQFVIISPEKVPSQVASKLLEPEEYLLVCTSKWKNRKITDILHTERIIDFDETDQMSFNYLKKYDLLPYIQPERLFINRTDLLADLLVKGVGYGVLAKEFSEQLLDNGKLIALNNAKPYINSLSLAWYHREKPPRYLSAIISAIK